MLFGETVPTHVGTDQRPIDVGQLRCGDLDLQAGLDLSLEDPTESLFAPTLADTRQARMVR